MTGVLDRTIVGEPFPECTPEADGDERRVSDAAREHDQDEEEHGVWGEHNDTFADPSAADAGGGAGGAAVTGLRPSASGAAVRRPSTEQRGALRLASPEASAHDAGAMALDSPADPTAALPRHLVLPTPSSRGDGDGEVFDEGASSRGRGGIISWLFGGGGGSSSRVHPLPAVAAHRSQPSQASTGANSSSSGSSAGTNPAPASGGSGLVIDGAAATGTVAAHGGMPASGAAATTGGAAPHAHAGGHPAAAVAAPPASAATAANDRTLSVPPHPSTSGMPQPVAVAVSVGSGTTGSDLIVTSGDSFPSTEASSSGDGADRPWSGESSGAAVDDDAIRRDALVVAPFNMLSTVREVTEASVLDV